MIRKFERDLLTKLDFGKKYLEFKVKFKRQQEIPTIPKSEIIKIFKELEYKAVRYESGGGYTVCSRVFRNYEFVCQMHITKNSVFTYIYIY